MGRPQWYKRVLYHVLWWMGGFLERLPVTLRGLGTKALNQNWFHKPKVQP